MIADQWRDHALAHPSRQLLVTAVDGLGFVCVVLLPVHAVDRVVLHQGMAECRFRDVSAGEADEPGDGDHVSAHATGTPHGDLAEARALSSQFPAPPPVSAVTAVTAVTAVKGTLGHSIGAAGAIDLDVVTGAPRPLPLRTTLVNASGFGGQNAVLALSAA
ncbi:hypothetical protein ACIBUY_36410 [Streptomyces sp. NPDC050085]|uniref:hypothetical protein n=1 Tax=Streptomyces sp. NPDC050085 TaxID=3365600 RepID=UPI00379D7A35